MFFLLNLLVYLFKLNFKKFRQQRLLNYLNKLKKKFKIFYFSCFFIFQILSIFFKRNFYFVMLFRVYRFSNNFASRKIKNTGKSI